MHAQGRTRAAVDGQRPRLRAAARARRRAPAAARQLHAARAGRARRRRARPRPPRSPPRRPSPDGRPLASRGDYLVLAPYQHLWLTNSPGTCGWSRTRSGRSPRRLIAGDAARGDPRPSSCSSGAGLEAMLGDAARASRSSARPWICSELWPLLESLARGGARPRPAAARARDRALPAGAHPAHPRCRVVLYATPRRRGGRRTRGGPRGSSTGRRTSTCSSQAIWDRGQRRARCCPR